MTLAALPASPGIFSLVYDKVDELITSRFHGRRGAGLQPDLGGGTDERVQFARIMTRSAELKLECARSLAGAVLGVVDICERSLRSGGKLMFCGNGGSAAHSQHLATELLIRLRSSVERSSWPRLR